MQTLIEQYNEIYEKISALNSQISDYESQIQELTTHRDEEIPERIQNLKAQLEKIDEYQLKISGFIQLAEKHMTSKNLLSIEAPPEYRVNLNRLRYWSTLIDPLGEDDVYAQKVYLVANCDLKFLEQKKEEFTARIKELEDDYAIGAPGQLLELDQKISAIRDKINEFIESDQVSEFAANVRRENESHMYLETPDTYTDYNSDPELWFPGAFGTAIDVIESQRESLKQSLGRFYDEKASKVYLPLERIPTNEEFAMTISCVPARKKLSEMDAGIRNLLFQIIDRSPAGSRKIYIIDAIRQNSALIGGLRGLENTEVLDPVPRNEEQIEQTLENIVGNFSDIDDVLEGYDTVIEYNQAVEADKRIQRSVVVIVGWPDELKGEAAGLVKKILSNYERYGISFIAVKVSSEVDKQQKFGLSDYVGENIIAITMTMKETNIRIGNEEAHSFAWYPFKHKLADSYCSTFESLSKGNTQRVTEYAERGLLDGGINYTRNFKTIKLPYGVDGKDVLHSIEFNNENFAAFLMGASGSGKSTLLHVLITGIIKNYHPDDVELWLADFKMAEFAQYIDPMPPHIKYILLDESQELICDLIDKLTDKMMERQRFFMMHRDYENKVESLPAVEYMPLIFVILDEFSIMSQVLNENPQYKLKLQNLLAKGRALGFKFLFSSQTFTSGVSGLTETAKAQIQMRIAMKGDKNEVISTMELSSNQRTDQVQNWIDAFPVYHALIKYREKLEDGDEKVLVRRTKVLYFNDKEKNEYGHKDPYKKQRKLINEINEKVHPVQDYNKDDIASYVDKRSVVVNGNTYDMYDENLLAERYKEAREEQIAEDEVLVSFGRPRLMSDMRLCSITQEARENILLFGAINEQVCVTSIIASVAKQFKAQNHNIQIWTSSRSRIFVRYESIFRELGVIVKDMEEICSSIRDIKDKIMNKTAGSDLIIMLGMERICGDFAFMDIGTTTNKKQVKSSSVEYQKVAPPKQLTEKESIKVSDALGWAKEKRRIKNENKGMPAEELQKIIDKAYKDYFAAKNEERNNSIAETKTTENAKTVENAPEADTDVKPVDQTEAQKDSTDDNTQSSVYNALDDLRFIMMHGSRNGYHFMTYLCNCADLKTTTFKEDWFRHRLSFQQSVEDSVRIFGNRVASQLPEHVCEYYDLLEKFSFRPYLNKGLDWDGWGVSDTGELISPYQQG